LKIFVCGDSFTYGEELDNREISAWPYLLAGSLSAELVDTSQKASSNQRIVYQTTKNFFKDFDLYLIAWSEYARFTFYKSDNNYEMAFTPQLADEVYYNHAYYRDWGNTLYKHWFNELFGFKLWLQQIIQVQSLLDGKNYLMINTFPNNLDCWLSDKYVFIEKVKHLINFDCMNDEQIMEEYDEIQSYMSQIDTSKFYGWGDFYITKLCQSFKIGNGGHILEDGHKHLSELILETINNQGGN
jgi:hypothetical protein